MFLEPGAELSSYSSNTSIAFSSWKATARLSCAGRMSEQRPDLLEVMMLLEHLHGDAVPQIVRLQRRTADQAPRLRLPVAWSRSCSRAICERSPWAASRSVSCRPRCCC